MKNEIKGIKIKNTVRVRLCGSYYVFSVLSSFSNLINVFFILALKRRSVAKITLTLFDGPIYGDAVVQMWFIIIWTASYNRYP